MLLGGWKAHNTERAVLTLTQLAILHTPALSSTDKETHLFHVLLPQTP